jgi:hypothetical protein
MNREATMRGAQVTMTEPAAKVELTEAYHGRNKIRVGDIVHVKGRTKGKHGFDAVVTRIIGRPDGRIEYEVYGGTGGERSIRTFSPERIQRRAQTVVRRRQPKHATKED